MTTHRKYNVLFLCSDNAVRSQLAEGFASALLAELVVSYSAGIEQGEIDPLVAEVLREHGGNMTSLIAQRLADLPMVAYDVVVTLDDSVRHVAASITGTPLTIHHHFADLRDVAATQTPEDRRRAVAMLALNIKDMVSDLPRYLAALPVEQH
jgi:arsenate reductase